MKDLKIIERENQLAIDSRQVAKMTGKQHAHLCRDIEGYINILSQNPTLDSDNYFIENSYTAGTGKAYKCYLLTKKGCDMIANKMIGEKGILFTAQYIDKFYEMERIILKKSLQKSDLSKDIKKQFDIVDKIAWANKTGNTELVKLSLLKIQSSTGHDMSDYIKFLQPMKLPNNELGIREQVKIFIQEIRKNINKYPDDGVYIHLPPGEETRICNEFKLDRLGILRELANAEKIKISFTFGKDGTPKRLFVSKSKFHNRKCCLKFYTRVFN